VQSLELDSIFRPPVASRAIGWLQLRKELGAERGVEIGLVGRAGHSRLDLLASVASRTIGFRYSYATVDSWLIYAAFGFMIGRRLNAFAASQGVAVIAVVEAAIGWAVSWVSGPGRLPNGTPTIGVPAITAPDRPSLRLDEMMEHNYLTILVSARTRRGESIGGAK
jgi:hypothetical protein